MSVLLVAVLVVIAIVAVAYVWKGPALRSGGDADEGRGQSPGPVFSDGPPSVGGGDGGAGGAA